MSYRCEAVSVAGFVQQLACNLLPAGYFFYVQDRIPSGKNAKAVDAKLVSRYGADASTSKRARRKRAGLANVQYIRHGRDFLLLCTLGSGEHRFWVEESKLDASGHEVRIKDVRRVAIKAFGYSVRVVQGGYLRKAGPDAPAVSDGKLRVRVSIGRERYLDLKNYFLDIATRLPADELGRMFFAVPFEPYAAVRVQLKVILRAVNAARHAAGLERLPVSVIRTKRNLVKPFGEAEGGTLAA